MENYWREQLSQRDKAFYDAIYSAALREKPSAPLPRGNTDFVRVFEAATFDHPEIFWMGSRCGVSGNFAGLSLQFSPLYTGLERRRVKAQTEQARDEAVRRASAFTDERDRLRAVAEYLMENAVYAIDNEMNQNAASVLAFHRAQCTGFAMAAKYILDALGIWCAVLNGTIVDSSANGPHCWNIVRVNGQYYHFDVTLMLGANGGGNGAAAQKPFRYLYLTYSDREIRKNHAWNAATPPCTDGQYDSAPQPQQPYAQPQPQQPYGQPQPQYGQSTPQPAQRFARPQQPYAQPQPQQPYGHPQPQYGQPTPQPAQRFARPQPQPQPYSPAPQRKIGVAQVRSQYDLLRLFPAAPQTDVHAEFYYEIAETDERKKELIEDAIRNYFKRNGLSGSYTISMLNDLWTIGLKFGRN